MSINILIVDDEPKIVELISAYLEKENFHVFTAFDGKEALEIFNNNEIDLIVLDLMLPGLSGEEVCIEIRKRSDVPIIMLTAKAQEYETLNGFNIGSDDYVTKPFSPKILLARIKAILNRTEKNREANKERVFFNENELMIDFTLLEVKKNDELVSLTLSEFNILAALAQNKNKIFTRLELIDNVFSEESDIYDRTIDSHIKNLRSKIENDTKNPVYIITIHGVGYKFGGV